MKFLPSLKRFIYIAAAMAVTGMFASCSKSDVKIIPGKYDPNGIGVTGSTGVIGGTGTTDSTGNLTSSFLFSSPDDVATDAAGNIYVADYGNDIIQKITPSGVISTLAGNGNIGSINAIGSLASFSGPSGVAVDGAGNVYVADEGNNLIRKITSDGTTSTLAGTVVAVDTSNTVTGEPLFSGPSGVAVDASGKVYVADAGNNRICVVSPAGITTTLAGNGNAGSNNGTGANATFNNPTGLAVDAAGNIYVADLLNNMIRKITPAGVVTTLAGSGDTGSSDGAGSTASFYFPNSVAVDAAGNVYVTDDVNNLIRKITPDGTVSTIAGNGLAGFANGTGTAASFNDPAGIATDAGGNLYIADANNNMIRKITSGGVVTTLAGALSTVASRRNLPHLYYHTGKALSHKVILKNRTR